MGKDENLALGVLQAFPKNLPSYPRFELIFPREDLNPHKQIQSLLCYHYTTGE